MASDLLEQTQEIYRIRDRYPIHILPQPDDERFVVAIPDLGVASHGRAIIETLLRAQEDARQKIITLLETGQPLPEPTLIDQILGFFHPSEEGGTS